MQPVVVAGRPGLFDADAVPWGWFDDCGQDQGWFDRDLLVYPLAIPPPPPPPPPPPVPRRPRPNRVTGGGNAVFVNPIVLPDWIRRFYVLPEIEEEQREEEADYALVHITEGVVVRAMAAGVVESMLDSKGRRSIVLTAADGTRYWYADIDKAVVKDGAHVQQGQPIARAKPNAPSIPTVTTGESKRAALPPAAGADAESELLGEPTDGPPPPPATPPAQPAKKPPPAQVVFVEAPPAPPPPGTRLVQLVRVAPPPPPPPKKTWLPSWAMTGAVAGVVAAVLYALSLLKSRRPPALPRPRKKKRKRRPTRRRQP